MTIALALGMVALAIVLLSMERIPIEVSSLGIVVLLVLSGLVTPEEGLAGFSSETAIFIFALLALTQGLGATGVMQIVGRRMVVFARYGPLAFVGLTLVVVAAFSSVASNTAVTAAFLPVVIGSAAQAKVPVSRMLLPMAFASMLGGMITLFGTSTNLVVSGAMEGMGLRRIGVLELAPVGLPLAAIGLVATLFFVRRLLPAREAKDESPLAQREYLTEAALTRRSRLTGRKLRALTDSFHAPVRGVVREGRLLPPDPGLVLAADDHLIISGGLEDILRIKDLRSIGLRAELREGDDPRKPPMLVEASIPPTSMLIGRTLRSTRFGERFGLRVLAIHRHPTLQILHGHLDLLGKVAQGRALADIPFSAGDLLLISGTEGRVRELSQDAELTVLGGVEYEPPRYRRALLAIAIFIATIVVAGMNLTSPAIVGLAGLLVMVLSGCVDARTAFRVDWRIVIMIGALLTLGRAMDESGAGALLAQGVLPLAGLIGPRGVLVVLMVTTVLLSIPMSNQAAALLMLPVGVHAAAGLGLEPRTFAIGICFAASCSFLTPLEPSAALVFGPGRYRFSDFIRVGGPLSALMLALLTVGVPLVWPFTAR